MTRIYKQFKIGLFLMSLMLLSQVTFAQVLVKGKVTDETGAALPGVNIIELNSSKGTVTDAEGKYELSVSDGSTTLAFSFIGYVTQKIAIADRAIVDVAMEPDVQSLAE